MVQITVTKHGLVWLYGDSYKDAASNARRILIARSVTRKRS